MSVTTNVPEQQLFFSGRRLDGGVREGVSQMSRNGNALPMAGEPIGRCGIVFRGFSHYSTVLRDLLVCVCVCVCQHGKKTLLVCTLNGIALRKRPKFQNVESLRVAFTNERRGVWLGNPRDGSPLLHESFSKPVTMSM